MIMKMMMRAVSWPAWLLVLAATAPAPGRDVTVTVFDGARIDFVPELVDGAMREGLVTHDRGRVVERAAALPAPPRDQRDARRIVASVRATPIVVEADGVRRPADIWSRLGSVLVVTPGGEVEIMRFATGFGAAATLSQDVTAFAPLLHGRRTMQLRLDTVSSPGWQVSVELAFLDEGAGFRRPVYVEPLFNEAALTTDRPRAHRVINVPAGLAPPRVRILCTGHTTDEGPEYEFVTANHVLRVDGRVLVQWRPWVEDGGVNRPANPWAGRQTIDGRELWSSDLDRTGWLPGTVVAPLIVPAPELTPGEHRVEIEILGPQASDRDHDHGYWRISAVVIADEPWPAPTGAQGR